MRLVEEVACGLPLFCWILTAFDSHMGAVGKPIAVGAGSRHLDGSCCRVAQLSRFFKFSNRLAYGNCARVRKMTVLFFDK